MDVVLGWCDEESVCPAISAGERSIGGCASYKVRLLLGARDSLSDLFGWPTFDYQSLHWKRVMPCVYGWKFSGLQRS